MRVISAALCAAGLLLTAPVAHAEPAGAYIDHTEWVQWGDLKSLRVYPTAVGRAEAGTPGTLLQQNQAWAEVLTISPEADIPGMQAQFNCHWQFAEFAHPGKTSWNLEPWRPEVTDAELVAAGCNPGGTEEPT
ncbi:MAG: DUF2599 domain-containing protein [Mycobacterium sp.]|nr:DUF2599 domain-containing protein [Mycobacterium sp.]